MNFLHRARVYQKQEAEKIFTDKMGLTCLSKIFDYVSKETEANCIHNKQTGVLIDMGELLDGSNYYNEMSLDAGGLEKSRSAAQELAPRSSKRSKS